MRGCRQVLVLLLLLPACSGEPRAGWLQLGTLLESQPLTEPVAGHAFGVVPAGEVREGRLRVRNVGSGTVSLHEPRFLEGAASTVRTWGSADTVFTLHRPKVAALEPGEETWLSVFFRATVPEDGLSEHHEARFVLVGEAAGRTLEVPFVLLGDAVDGACIAPGELDFGEVDGCEAQTAAITLFNPGQEAHTFELSVSHPAFLLEEGGQRAEVRVAAGSRHRVSLRYAPTREGLQEGLLHIPPTGLCPARTVRLTGRGRGVPVALRVENGPRCRSEGPEGCQDTAVECGVLAPEDTVLRSLVLENRCPQPLQLSGGTFSGQSEAFQLLPPGPGWPVPLPPGAPVSLGVRCRGEGLESQLANLRLELDAPFVRHLALVPVRATSGRPRLVLSDVYGTHRLVAPWFTTSQEQGYGEVAIFLQNATQPPDVAPERATLVLGTQPGGGEAPLASFTWEEGQEGPGALSLHLPGGEPVEALALAPGERAQLRVRLSPTAVGAADATLTLHSNSASGGVSSLALATEVLPVPPCRLQVEPAAVDFGRLTEDSTQAVTLTNLGSAPDEECLVQVMGLLPGSHPQWRVLRDEEPVRLPAGGTRRVTVFTSSLDGVEAGTWMEGTLQVLVSSPTQPALHLPVRGVR